MQIGLRRVYNRVMALSRGLPDRNQLSVLVATILLAYASLPYINLPQREVALSLPGILLTFRVGADTAVGVLVAGLAGSGTFWLLRMHPNATGRQVYPHLLLPGLTALVIGVPLSTQEVSPIWWLIFITGGLVLLLVIASEYITMSPNDIRQPVAAGFLTAVAFAILLLLVINNFANGARLFLVLPVTFFASWLVALRALHERLSGGWMFPQAAVIALITTQLAAAYHYLPLSHLTAGLLCVGPAFALTQLVGNLSQGLKASEAVIEPMVSLALIIGIAVWIQ